VTGITGLWYGILVLLVSGHSVYADQKYLNCANKPPEAKSNSGVKDTNDPNEQWWSRWDAVIKNPSDANELLEAKCRAVVKVLRHKEFDEKLKEKITDKIMSPVFDFPLMTKLALGRENWLKLTEQQRNKFTKLFAERLKSSYLEKITLYKDEKVSFIPAKHQRRDAVHIPMVLISNDKEVAILYKLYKMNECWKIYDVEIEGISILLTYRSQFDDILRRGSVKDLFDQLEKPPAQ